MTSAWGITDGSAGMQAQVTALATILGMDVQMKTIVLKPAFAWLPNGAYRGVLKRLIIPYLLDKSSDDLSEPLPDVVISCGRRGGLIAAGLRARSTGNTRFINIQDPRMDADNFDIVVAMAHDKITGKNVIKTNYALHRITEEALEEARQIFLPRFEHYPMPVAAVLLGGSTNKYELTTEAMSKVVMSLQRLISQTQASVLITPSRRTGEVNSSMLQALTGKYADRVYVYDGQEDNPYMGMLALAEFIIVTNDSVNMMSEAVATGKPVYILPLPGHTDTKPSRFAERLIRDGLARPLVNKLEHWEYPIPNEMQQLAEDITQRLENL